MKTWARATAALAFLLGMTGCGQLSPGRAARLSTAYVSQELCTAVFLAGRDAAHYHARALAPLGGPLAPLLSYSVDRERGEVRSTLAGLAESRAVYQPPLGCTLAGSAGAPGLDRRPASPAPVARDALTDFGGPAPVVPTNAVLKAAIDQAFEETERPPHRYTDAVVVVQGGRIVAERYAPGVDVNTPLLGWSLGKSVLNALAGVLVQQGRLDVHQPAPVAAWEGAEDPRHAITVDQLLRMTSGLAMGESLRTGLAAAFDPSVQLMQIEPDTAARAARAPLAHPPGTVWTYSNGNTQVLAGIVRDLAGGTGAATRAWAKRALFERIGMRQVTLDFDAAGAPLAASRVWAPARDWARLGLLFLRDGVLGGERLLPAGWVQYSATLTPGSEALGYGAGFWTNRDGGQGARARIAAGMPADAFMARGSKGQYVVIVPSADLVVVRLGQAWTSREDEAAVSRLTRAAIDAGRQPRP